MAPSTQRYATPLSPGFAFFVACFAVVEHALLLGIAIALMPLGAIPLCLLECGNVLVAGLLFFHLQRTHTDPILPMLLTATAAVAVPWTMLLFAQWRLPYGLHWLAGFIVPYLIALAFTARRR